MDIGVMGQKISELFFNQNRNARVRIGFAQRFKDGQREHNIS